MDALENAREGGGEAVSENTEPVSMDEMLAERAAKREAQRQEPETQTEEPDEVENTTENGDTEEQEESTSETTLEDASEPEEVNVSEDETEEGEAQETLIEPPQFWSAEGKKHWGNLDPVTQAFVADQDKKAQAFVTKAQAEAKAEGLKANQQAMQAVQTKLTQFDGAIAMAENLFSEQFASDAQLAEFIQSGEVTAEQAYTHQMKRSAAQGSLDKLKAARDQERQAYVANNIQTRTQILNERNPDVVKDAKELVTELMQRGFTQERIDMATADELELVWESMMYRKGKSAAQKLKPPPKAPPKVLKPKTRTQGGNPQDAQLAKLKKRADETGDMNDILAHRQAKREAARRKTR